jgi:hypothetical protein
MIDIEKSKSTGRRLRSRTKRDVVYDMSEYEIARWMSLIEAVDIIGGKIDQLGAKGTGVNWVKPIAIQKYVDERTDSMLHEIHDDLSKEEQCTI